MGGGNGGIGTGSAAPNDDEVVFNGHCSMGGRLEGWKVGRLKGLLLKVITCNLLTC
jgi:hypothetical protein